MPNQAYTQTILTSMQGMFPDTGYGWYSPGNPVQAPTRIASVTDGTSNTFLFGERRKVSSARWVVVPAAVALMRAMAGGRMLTTAILRCQPFTLRT